jgi:hypothetical protein
MVLSTPTLHMKQRAMFIVGIFLPLGLIYVRTLVYNSYVASISFIWRTMAIPNVFVVSSKPMVT